MAFGPAPYPSQSHAQDYLITNRQNVTNGALTHQIRGENMPLVSKCSLSVTTRQVATHEARRRRIRATPVAGDPCLAEGVVAL